MAAGQDTGSNSPWRTLLSFALLAFALIRLAMTCSHSNQPVPGPLPELEQIQQQHQEIRASRNLQQTISNQMLYSDYNALNSLDASSKRLYGIVKIEKDSVIRFDLGSDLKLERGYFLQNNRDDSLKIAVRTPDMSLFFHDFASNNGDEYNMRSIKRGLALEEFKADKLKKLKAYSYTIRKNNKKLNGYAVTFGSKGYPVYAEFESAQLDKTTLRAKALLFLIGHIKAQKP
jgi:hypothetical protein